MENEKGWIKLHRKLKDKGYYNNSKFVHLWIHLLLSVNHKKKEFMWNNNLILIKEGQFITGRDKLSKETGINRSSIDRILKVLESEHQIEQQKTNKYRLITILNWKEHQKENIKLSNKRATDEQQMSTNKNNNNEKNDNNIVTDGDIPFSLKEEIQKLYDNKRRDLNIIGLYFEYRQPQFENRKQYEIGLKRHLKAANELKEFSDSQIIKAIDYAKKEYKDVYTLETLIKILSK